MFKLMLIVSTALLTSCVSVQHLYLIGYKLTVVNCLDISKVENDHLKENTNATEQSNGYDYETDM